MKFEIGDSIIIKDKFWKIPVPEDEDPGIRDLMKRLVGKHFEIDDISHLKNCYYADGWIWHENWIEKITTIKQIKDFNEEDIINML